MFLGKVNSTIEDMTDDTVTISEVAGVYVLTDDPAQKIKDAADYTFAYTTIYGDETTMEAIDAINEETGSDIETVEYDSVTEMVDALYAGDVQAMIMDETYEAVVNDTEGYEGFSEKVRIIYEHTRSYTEQKEDSNLDVTEDPFCVYISGSDTRSATLAKSRSDVNLLAFVNSIPFIGIRWLRRECLYVNAIMDNLNITIFKMRLTEGISQPYRHGHDGERRNSRHQFFL